jgi:Holliday junction resolvase RusA-like endonuclease
MGTTPPLEGALALGMCVYRPIPKSFSKRRREAAERGKLRPITKPDLDNYVKAAKDALKGVVWADDSQIVDYIEPFGKFYSERPRIEIVVTTLEERGNAKDYISDVWREVNKLAESIVEGRVSVADLQHTLKEEYGIEL